ncbi:unnamed protein product [Phyllotreta striolata]|uniref:Golgin-45 n=1 Tax=Phyllotreta striolata TaxID=444603 RepID=A0A9N9TNJ7_PHYSR|nr:unnamed protein product [Phyllotreta striolata]
MERTQGDGIDNSTFDKDPSTAMESLINSEMAVKRSMKILQSLRPVQPNSRVYYLTPKHAYKPRPAPNYFVQKQKEPKFVPCEPYKAAVEPMTGRSKPRSPKKAAKNDMDLSNLVSQLSDVRKTELAGSNQVCSPEDSFNSKLISQWRKEKEQYESDVENLRSSNNLLENQLKFQAQVNGELKTLLVAAVGEDLENRVQHLTEDKLSLARELLKSANHITSHQEQTEWLSGQCEVWRSKFLASSVMVEELAKWKAALANRITELQETTRTLLDERRRIHNQQMEMYENLKAINEKMDENYRTAPLKYGNVLEATSANVELTRNLKTYLNIDCCTDKEEATASRHMTLAEKNGYKLVNNPVTISNKPDAICKAVLGAASNVGSQQMFLQYPSLHPCCARCTGTVQNI